MNRGFTLIEILVVIALLAVVTLVIANNMVGMQGRERENEYENYKMRLESAACSYIEKMDYSDKKSECKRNASSESCKITIKNLIESGLIADDMYNPKEGKVVGDRELLDDYVLVQYVRGEKTCTLQE